MAERDYVVLSALGPDRPGLVAALTACVVEHGGNVEDSRMAGLGGLFGIMMLVSGESGQLAGLKPATDALEPATGLRITLVPTAAKVEAGGLTRLEITCEAVDREGIVHAIASCLHDLNGNIVELESTRYQAPVSGAPLFRLELKVDLPHQSAAAAEEALEALAEREGLDCSVAAV